MKETIEFIDNQKIKEKIGELLTDGYRWQCLVCGLVYKNKPQEDYEDGHGGRSINMCHCGNDLFGELKDISHKSVQVTPIDNMIVLKEHHFKYCKCEHGKIWTGDAETECWMMGRLSLIERTTNQKILECPKSELKLIILKSTKEELERPDEMGSKFLRFPR